MTHLNRHPSLGLAFSLRGRIDPLAPDDFKYTITAREIAKA